MHYLENPNATDTIDGIAEWRLLEEMVHRRVRETQAAVQWLVDRGFLEQIERAAIPALFRLNVAKRGDAERWLKEHSPEAEDR